MTATDTLGMNLVDGTDTISGTSSTTSLQGKVNAALEEIDNAVGIHFCTSGTRPATPFPRMPIYETDTRLMLVRNVANTSWQLVNTGIPVVATTGAITPFTGLIVYDLSVPALKRYTGSVWVLMNGNEDTKYKSVNESVTNSTTLQNDDHFLWSNLQPGAFKVDGYLAYDGASDGGTGAGGLKTAWTGPTGSSMFYTNFGTNAAAASPLTLRDYNVVAEGMGAPGRVVGTNGATPMSMSPKGVIVIGATAGDVRLQWAQGTSNGTATRILAGSWISLTKIV